jgi:hypothetical protein
MIVRNAERSFRRALSSALPFVDEIVVVDTGSADKTRQIAKELGARLFDFAWRDDFSAARNYSLQQATGDWIFWMDADDVLPESSSVAPVASPTGACKRQHTHQAEPWRAGGTCGYVELSEIVTMEGHAPSWPGPGRRVASTFYGYDGMAG